MKTSLNISTILLLLMVSLIDANLNTARAQSTASVTYLGNEGLLFVDGEVSVLFDPFFHNDYGQYQLVPEETLSAIFSQQAPFDDIDVIVVSHAHGDHFAADRMVEYLNKNPNVQLVAPTQAIEKLIGDFSGQVIGIDLGFGDSPVRHELESIRIESVRIPHAGWPGRKEISNLVHRVTLNNSKTIIHMGDADPDDEHFAPYKDHWLAQQSDAAFPPYWFFLSQQGPTILSQRINAKQSVGVHVPVSVPQELTLSGAQYFSLPGEKISIE